MAHPVLIVDDDTDIRTALVDVLEEHGYEAISAVNGRDALNKLRQAEPKPCLIVLDLMMPVMDGRSFREEQLKTPEFADIPVVVVTAYRDVTDDLRGTDFLKKPVDLEDLLAAARKHCNPGEVA